MPNNILITPGQATIDFSGSAAGNTLANTLRLQVLSDASVVITGSVGEIARFFPSGQVWVTSSAQSSIAAHQFTGSLGIVSFIGTASRVENGVYTVGNQTIAGVKTFSDSISFSNAGAINAINLNNNNIVGVNTIEISDPGPNEGISWLGGNLWKIYESPNNLTSNTGGNLQIVENATRRATFNTSGQFELPVTTGTAPLVISSTTLVSNLNADLLDGLHATSLFNNMGEAHGTRTSFDATTPSYDFGFRYVQGSTNGPNTGGSQYYSWYIGLGSQYPATGAGSYGAMFAVDRNTSGPYLSVRYNEANSFGPWRKIYAGYADSAGAVSWPNVTTGTRTNYNLDFKPSAGDYAGFRFTRSTSADGTGDAGYFLIRGTSDNDVYTAEGITLVADAGWLTLAQRTTAARGVRIMTGTTAASRALFYTDGTVEYTGTTYNYSNAGQILFNHTTNNTNVPFDMRKGGATISDDGTYGVLYLSRENSNNSATGAGANLYFVLKDSGGTYREYAGIGGRKTEAGNAGGALYFYRIGRTVMGYWDATALYASAFYDYDNSAYYVNPDGTSNFWNVQFLNGKWYTVNNGSGNSIEIYVRPDNNTTYVWRHIYGGSGTGFGTGVGGYGVYYNGNGDYNAIYSPSGFVTFPYSARSPIFYDSINTGFFLDPNAGKSLRIAGGIAQNNIVGRPVAYWGATSATGAVIIKFPGGSGNYGMIHAQIDIYEYSGNAAATIIVGGHNWNGAWYNISAEVIGQTDKPVRVGFKDGRYCIVIGNGSSNWSYGQVVLRKIQNGTYYDGVMEVAEGYSVAIESDSYSYISGDLRNLRTPLAFSAGTAIYSPIYYDTNDTNYVIDPRSTSRLSGLRLDGVDNQASGEDAILWINKPNNNDWGIIISNNLDYGADFRMSDSAGFAFRVLGSGNERFVVRGDGQTIIRNNNPTITFRDTDHNTAFIHVNSNIFYILRGGVDVGHGNWGTVNGYWPLEINLTNNNALFGGNVYIGADARYFGMNTTSNWGGDPGNGWAKLEYHSNRWYIAAGADSTEIARIRRGGSDQAIITNEGSYTNLTYNKPDILTRASGTASSGASLAIQQETGEGWTGIFVDFEPYTGWGFYHDNPNNFFSFTSEGSTGQIRSFTVPSRVSGNRTAYEKFRIDQNNGDFITGRDGYAQGAFYAPVFIDTGNTAYRADPNGTSRFSSTVSDESYTYGWFRNYTSGHGLYNQATVMHWYSNNGYWKSAGGGYGYGAVVMYNNYESDIRGYAGYWDGSGFGMLNSSGNWQIRIEYGNANMELYRTTWGNEMNAYIYRDRDNTAFYTDPHSFSRFNELGLNKIRADTNGNYADNAGWWTHDPYGQGWGKPHGSFRTLEVSTSGNFSTEPAMFRIHQWGSGSAEFWKPQGTILYLRETPLSVGGGRHGNWFTRFIVQRYIESDEGMDSPIFRDRDNTGYYVDPTSVSQLSYVLANDWFRPQGCTGLYWQTYGRGIWSPECEGNAYGHVATYGGGRNGWYGYGIGSRYVFMSTMGDNVGVHDNSRGWIWYMSGAILYLYWASNERMSMQSYGVYVNNEIRSPIFYDHDTGYYFDGNGTSSWNWVTDRSKDRVGNTAKYNNPRSNITSDSNYWVGTMGWGTTDFLSMWNWGSGFIDSWGNPANQPAGTSHWVGVQAAHYTCGYNCGYGWQMVGGPIAGLWFRNYWSSASSWKKIAMYGLNEYSSDFYASVYYDSEDTYWVWDGTAGIGNNKSIRVYGNISNTNYANDVYSIPGTLSFGRSDRNDFRSYTSLWYAMKFSHSADPGHWQWSHHIGGCCMFSMMHYSYNTLTLGGSSIGWGQLSRVRVTTNQGFEVQNYDQSGEIGDTIRAIAYGNPFYSTLFRGYLESGNSGWEKYIMLTTNFGTITHVVYGNGSTYNQTGTYGVWSDISLKQDIIDASPQWDDIKQLRLVKFRLKDEVSLLGDAAPHQLGLIAQEVEQVSPGLITESDVMEEYEEDEINVQGIPTGKKVKKQRKTGQKLKAVKQSILYMKAIKALQEAMARIETLEEEIRILKAG